MGYIYQIVDTTTHEYYIGKKCNTNPDTDNYWGSGRNRLCNAAKKYNGANGRYRKDILINGVCNEKLGKLEEILIGDRYQTDSLCLNRKAGGIGGAAIGNTNAKGCKGKVLSQKTRDLIGAANRSRVISQATKDRMSAARKGNKNNLGKVRTDAQNAAKSARMKEYWRLRKLKENI